MSPNKMKVLKKGSVNLKRICFLFRFDRSQNQHIQQEFDKEHQTCLEYSVRLKNEQKLAPLFFLTYVCSQSQILQTDNCRLHESIDHLREEREKEIRENERLMNEKEKEFCQEKEDLEKKHEKFRLQMDERIADLSSQLDHLQQELESKQQIVSKQSSLVRITFHSFTRLSLAKANCITSNKKWKKLRMQRQQHKRRGKSYLPRTSNSTEKFFSCVTYE